MTSRHFCFTLNNYNDDDIKLVLNDKPTYVRYVIIGFEIGESGTPHLQGYTEFESPKRLAALKKWLPTAHWEPRRGDREIARLYCMKGIQTKDEWYSLDKEGNELRNNGPNFGKEAKIEERGDWKSGGHGSRSDLISIQQEIKEGASLKDLCNNHFEKFLRYQKGFEKAISFREEEQGRDFRNIEIFVLWGEAGIGKSRAVFDITKDLSVCSASPDNEQFPLSNYDGQEVLILDEFYGQIKFSEFLRMTSGHPYLVNTKGGCRHALFTKIYITSNSSPEEWYSGMISKHPKMHKALMRRLTHVTEITASSTLADCMKAAGETPKATEQGPARPEVSSNDSLRDTKLPGNTIQAPRINIEPTIEIQKIINYELDVLYDEFQDNKINKENYINEQIKIIKKYTEENNEIFIDTKYDNIEDIILNI